MPRNCLVAILLALISTNVQAQLAVSVGVEYFRWEEDIDSTVTETGPLFAIGLEYTRQRDAGFVYAYRAKAYFGDVDYDGTSLFFGTPLQGITTYTGIDNEIQARVRTPMENGYWGDIVLGVGLDRWRRELSARQREDFTIIYIRLGADFDTRASERWLIGFGVKYPLWTREDAHLTNIGFDSNPILKPGRDLSVYGRIGFHIDRNWTLIGYADGHRLKQSQPEPVNELLVIMGPVVVFQPASTMFIGGLKLQYTFQ